MPRLPQPLIRKRAPRRLTRRSAYLVRDTARQLTQRARALPDFLVMGTQKGGTTSLFKALARHPEVVPPVTKEIHFFDRHWQRGLAWYRAHFPVRWSLGTRLTGEASPSYMFAPGVAARSARSVPGVRLVALLRDPVDRAWSHYRMMRRMGREQRPFLRALEEEPDLLAAAEQALADDPDRDVPAFWRHSYLARGDYLAQLRRLERHHGDEHLLVLRSEDLFADRREALGDLADFLDLEGLADQPAPTAHTSPDRGAAMPSQARAFLERWFAPRNEALYAHLDWQLWTCGSG